MVKTSSMPKKTRREKLISANRKKIRLLQQLNEPQSVIDENQSKKSPIQQVLKEEYHPDSREMALKTFFIKDLRKSLLLSGLIIALEIIVYFGTISNYFKL